MKYLLITHTDLDGISPIILMNLTKEDFEFKSIDNNETEDTINELLESDLSIYKMIYIVDLTIPKHFYDKFANIKNIRIFDHHESHLYASSFEFATVKIEEYGHLTCGTELFHNYLKDIYPNLDTPLINNYVELVRQGDTWDFDDTDLAKQVGSLPYIYGKKAYIKSITKRLTKDKEKFELTAFEKRYVKIQNEELDRYLKYKEGKMQKYEINGYKVGVVFAENHKSELGNYLSSVNLDLELIIIISACERISYRTVHDDVKCNKFAELVGGGGHQKASGSDMSQEIRDEILSLYYKDVKRLEIEEI